MFDAVILFLAGLFILGTPLFWFLSIGLFILLVTLTEREHDVFAGIVLLVFIVTMSNVNENEFSAFDFVDYLKFAGIYFLAGTVWSLLKWVSFLFRSRDDLKKYKLEFIKSHNRKKDGREAVVEDVNTKLPKELFTEFALYLTNKKYLMSSTDRYAAQAINNPTDVIPNISNFKGRAVRWIIWWPFSAFWTILNDPIRRIAEYIFNSIQGLYRRIADKIFAGV